jgi:hypothetical protein
MVVLGVLSAASVFLTRWGPRAGTTSIATQAVGGAPAELLSFADGTSRERVAETVNNLLLRQ